MPVHVFQNATCIDGGQISPKRPWRIRVTDAESKVGNIAEHRALVNELAARLDRLTIDNELHAAQREHAQARCRDDNVGLKFLARLQPNALLGKRLDLIGHDRSLPRTDRLVQVGVGDEAEPLVPWLIAWVEML